MLFKHFIESFINFTFYKIKDFRTEEGNFSVYDIEKNPKRTALFTVLKSIDGYIVRNALVPEEMRKQGIATNFYIKMNKESLRKTGNSLRSTQPRKLITGEIVHELSPDAIALWDNFVNKGMARKLSEKNYVFN